MSAARVSSRAIRALTSTVSTQTRSLSITGPATFSSILTSDKPARGSNAPRLPASVTIPVPDTNDTSKPARHFNTSRSLKSVGDTSTIDFMYIPDFDPDLKSAPFEVRVPILPWAEAPNSVKEDLTEAETPVMMPTIHTVAADGTHIHAPSAMFDMTDSDQIDFQGMATSVASKLAEKSEEGAGMVGTIWKGLVEDVLGPKKGHARS